MIPFKQKPKSMLKHTTVLLIIISISQGSFSFLQQSTAVERNILPPLQESQRSFDDKKYTDTIIMQRDVSRNSPYIRDVRADSRQSRIDARDIRTDFREIRTELHLPANSRPDQRNSLKNLIQERQTPLNSGRTQVATGDSNNHNRHDSGDVRDLSLQRNAFIQRREVSSGRRYDSDNRREASRESRQDLRQREVRDLSLQRNAFIQRREVSSGRRYDSDNRREASRESSQDLRQREVTRDSLERRLTGEPSTGSGRRIIEKFFQQSLANQRRGIVEKRNARAVPQDRRLEAAREQKEREILSEMGRESPRGRQNNFEVRSQQERQRNDFSTRNSLERPTLIETSRASENRENNIQMTAISRENSQEQEASPQIQRELSRNTRDRRERHVARNGFLKSQQDRDEAYVDVTRKLIRDTRNNERHITRETLGNSRQDRRDRIQEFYNRPTTRESRHQREVVSQIQRDRSRESEVSFDRETTTNRRENLQRRTIRSEIQQARRQLQKSDNIQEQRTRFERDLLQGYEKIRSLINRKASQESRHYSARRDSIRHNIKEDSRKSRQERDVSARLRELPRERQDSLSRQTTTEVYRQNHQRDGVPDVRLSRRSPSRSELITREAPRESRQNTRDQREKLTRQASRGNEETRDDRRIIREASLQVRNSRDEVPKDERVIRDDDSRSRGRQVIRSETDTHRREIAYNTSYRRQPMGQFFKDLSLMRRDTTPLVNHQSTTRGQNNQEYQAPYIRNDQVRIEDRKTSQVQILRSLGKGNNRLDICKAHSSTRSSQSGEDTRYQKKSADVMDMRNILPAAKVLAPNYSTLMTGIQAVLLTLLLGQIVGRDYKGKLSFANWRHLSAKQKIY